MGSHTRSLRVQLYELQDNAKQLAENPKLETITVELATDIASLNSRLHYYLESIDEQRTAVV